MARLEGIHDFELTPILHRLKQAVARTANGVLAEPTPARRRAR
ncbi:hypothetical protein [Nocardia panacis]|nr:hypothetical protein [Nocardia panacis]